MGSREPQERKTLVAALGRNRGELDPARLAALLERLAAPKRTRAA